MPVTAKLSRAFYTKLGDEVANELVDWFNTVDLSYRAEFREMFETHFSRFEARLAQLSAELRAEMAQLSAELRADVAQLRSDNGNDLARVRSEGRSDLAQFRVEFTDRMNQLESRMFWWMFKYWVGSVAATIGIVLGAKQLLG